MNRRVLSGVLLLASALATVGAAVTAEPRDGIERNATIGSELPSEVALAAIGPETAGDAKVPVRPGLIDEQASGQADATDVALPVAVRSEDIKLDATILSVGVDAENRFDVPAADTVGWYRYSARPGDSGASVLAAHVDYGGRPGAFFNLRELRAGDRIEVEMSDGRTLGYEVTFNTQYDKSELPADELFRKTGDPVLQLITCGGTFDPERHSYKANVVISARPVTT